MGIYEIPRFYDSVGTDKSAMVAVVAGEENIKKEDILFYETVCRNRGYNIRVFTDRNSAVKWLRKEQS